MFSSQIPELSSENSRLLDMAESGLSSDWLKKMVPALLHAPANVVARPSVWNTVIWEICQYEEEAIELDLDDEVCN